MACALLEEAFSVLEGSAARLEHARTLVDLGATLRRRGRGTAAAERLRAGRDLAHRYVGRLTHVASEGMSNKEIAQAVVTLRTIEMYLSNSYRKFGDARRAELRSSCRGACDASRPSRRADRR